MYFAKDGLEGIRISKKLQPTLILLDIDMPGTNGLDVSGHNIDFMEIAALEAGAVDFIGKPIYGPIVQARVTTHLTLQAQSAALRKLAHQDGPTDLLNRRF